MHKRLNEIDYLRAASTLSVILIHVSAPYVAFSSLGYRANQLMRYAVPIFIILSGFSLYYSDMDRGRQSYAEFLKRKFVKIVIPYISWSVIYMLYSRIGYDESPDLHAIAKRLLYGHAAAHLYFIIIIIQLYLIYPLLHSLFQKHYKLILLAAFTVTLYYQTGIYLRALGIDILPKRDFLFPNYMMLFTWLFYFVLGMYLAKNMKILNSIGKHKATLAFMWLLSYFAVLADSRITNTLDLSIRPSVMLYSIISFGFIYSLCISINAAGRKTETFLRWVSANSFLIYFSHPLILSIAVRFIRHFGIGFVLERGMGMVLLYVAVCLITFLFAYILSLMPYSTYAGAGCSKGKPRAVL